MRLRRLAEGAQLSSGLRMKLESSRVDSYFLRMGSRLAHAQEVNCEGAVHSARGGRGPLLWAEGFTLLIRQRAGNLFWVIVTDALQECADVQSSGVLGFVDP
jgi:hypothetical protein